MFAPEDPTAINDIGEPPLGSRAGGPVWDYETCSFYSDALSVSVGVLASCPSLLSSVIGGSVTVVGASVDDGEFDGTSSACVIASDPPLASVVVEGVSVGGVLLVSESVEPGLAGSLGCEDSCELSVLFVAAV